MINQNLINDLKNQPALTEKNLQIIACAGSGKTEFISHRIAYIVAEIIAGSLLTEKSEFSVSCPIFVA